MKVSLDIENREKKKIKINRDNRNQSNDFNTLLGRFVLVTKKEKKNQILILYWSVGRL